MTENGPCIRKLDLSTIFQGLELFDELTALENIQVKNRQTGYYSDHTIREMASFLEVEHHLNRSVAILSYGQKQRIAIIRALCQPFSFLFADEIFSHLDNELVRKHLHLLNLNAGKGKQACCSRLYIEPADFSFDETYRI